MRPRYFRKLGITSRTTTLEEGRGQFGLVVCAKLQIKSWNIFAFGATWCFLYTLTITVMTRVSECWRGWGGQDAASSFVFVRNGRNQDCYICWLSWTAHGSMLLMLVIYLAWFRLGGNFCLLRKFNKTWLMSKEKIVLLVSNNKDHGLIPYTIALEGWI